MKILVLNAGSSSLKFQLFNMIDLSVLATGMIEQIGDDLGYAKLTCNDDTGGRQETEVSRAILDHSSAIRLMTTLLQENGVLTDVNELAGVGHRVFMEEKTFVSLSS